MSSLEVVSDSVMMGLSGDSEIFYIDRRESNKPNYFLNSKQYRSDGRDGKFQTLACNKSNTHEFAVGTDYNVKIFDFRQVKPSYEIYHNFNHFRKRICSVSWSPNGKYIFVSDVAEMDNPSHGLDDIFFFWDVLNAEGVISPQNITVEGTANKFNWDYYRPEYTWIDDHMVVSSDREEGNFLYAMAPHSTTIKTIDEFDPNSVVLVDQLAYNQKTFQLAGAGVEHITIWSHYKLPPYPSP